ncbi:hypothetical protein EVAR_94587_1 [Eumeta japonica]|uniref:Uncharacterized protein n=1 Tax=Eumeta variegata TaxID=151549 RepID=A0A4C1UTX7_EUMVA|nr:hypothetical protein EVAR_94587_1 [Eumeta japonica]
MSGTYNNKSCNTNFKILQKKLFYIAIYISCYARINKLTPRRERRRKNVQSPLEPDRKRRTYVVSASARSGHARGDRFATLLKYKTALIMRARASNKKHVLNVRTTLGERSFLSLQAENNIQKKDQDQHRYRNYERNRDKSPDQNYKRSHDCETELGLGPEGKLESESGIEIYRQIV